MSSLPLPETRKGVGSFQYDFDEFTTSPANIFDTPYVDTLVLDGKYFIIAQCFEIGK